MKKGFTLIELLAVIVILAVISIITVPMILNVVGETREAAFKDSVYSAFNAVEYYVIEKGLSDIPESGIEAEFLNLKNNNFESGRFIKNIDGTIIAEFVSDGNYCAYGTIENLLIKNDCNEMDITVPTSLAPTVVESSDIPQAIIVTNNQTDLGSGIDTNTLEYGYSLTVDGEYIWQSSNTITNLKASTTYYVKTRTNDIAGNGVVTSEYAIITISDPVLDARCSNIGEESGIYMCSLPDDSCVKTTYGASSSQVESYVFPVNSYNKTKIVSYGNASNFRFSADQTLFVIPTSNISEEQISMFSGYYIMNQYPAATVYGVGTYCSTEYVWKEIQK